MRECGVVTPLLPDRHGTAQGIANATAKFAPARFLSD